MGGERRREGGGKGGGRGRREEREGGGGKYMKMKVPNALYKNNCVNILVQFSCIHTVYTVGTHVYLAKLKCYDKVFS